MEDVLHVHSSHDGGSSCGKAIDQLHSLSLALMVWEPGRHLTEVPASAKLQGGESNTGPLPDSGHHRAFTVLHQKNLPEACLLRLEA